MKEKTNRYMEMLMKWPLMGILIASTLAMGNCDKSNGPVPPEPEPVGTVEQWLTTANQQSLLARQPEMLAFKSPASDDPVTAISIDPQRSYQEVDGFGYTLTGGSAELLHAMNAGERQKILQELFGTGAASIQVSYLRLSLGASDLSSRVFSYNDLPAGQTDTDLSEFSLADDTLHVIPVLKEILAIVPNIKILASPWSPPVWMKSNKHSIGGNLLPEYYDVYARYFVKYIQAMKTQGITIDAVTIQNEPHHPGNNPSLYMSATEQAQFTKQSLGPAFQTAGINTKIIIWDHNCNNPDYPITILNDPEAKKYINGSAFHLYEGDISALSKVRAAHPDKHLYFTEQWTGANGTFDGDFQWHIKNVIIGSMNNWSRNALEWNLASDPNFDPHTDGGCTECKGALTINGNTVSRNVGYYIIAQASKFVPPGSVRIHSEGAGTLPHVSFKTPAGKTVLLVLNEGQANQRFSIKSGGKTAIAFIPSKSSMTFVW